MSVEVRVPTLGESVVEATVSRWLKQAGEPVRVGESLVELETDKVNVEVAADATGTLESVLAEVGATVHPGDVIGTVAAGDGAAVKSKAEKAGATAAATTPSSLSVAEGGGASTPSGSEEVRRALEASHRRVHSMALIHEQLSEKDRLDRINFSEYAHQLVSHLRQAVVDEPTRVAIETELDPIELGIEQAVPCGLILNELLTNAFKYAFPGRNQGRILISFHESSPGTLELAVEDNGVGLSPELRSGRETSLGLRIVGILTNQLDGTLEHQPCAGTRIVLRFPLRTHVLLTPSRHA